MCPRKIKKGRQLCELEPKNTTWRRWNTLYIAKYTASGNYFRILGNGEVLLSWFLSASEVFTCLLPNKILNILLSDTNCPYFLSPELSSATLWNSQPNPYILVSFSGYSFHILAFNLIDSPLKILLPINPLRYFSVFSPHHSYHWAKR